MAYGTRGPGYRAGASCVSLTHLSPGTPVPGARGGAGDAPAPRSGGAEAPGARAGRTRRTRRTRGGATVVPAVVVPAVVAVLPVVVVPGPVLPAGARVLAAGHPLPADVHERGAGPALRPDEPEPVRVAEDALSLHGAQDAVLTARREPVDHGRVGGGLLSYVHVTAGDDGAPYGTVRAAATGGGVRRRGRRRGARHGDGENTAGEQAHSKGPQGRVGAH